jgi:hypothetical protein
VVKQNSHAGDGRRAAFTGAGPSPAFLPTLVPHLQLSMFRNPCTLEWINCRNPHVATWIDFPS